MTIAVTLSGSDVPYTPGTLSLAMEYGTRGTASLSLVDPTGAVDYDALKGEEVEFRDDVTLVRAFAGVLTIPKWTLILGSDAVEWTLDFSDFCALADRVRVYDYYDGASTPLTSDIVRAILTDYLAQFGVTEGVIEDGTAVSEVAYNGQKASAAFDELAKRDGFAWRIDDDKKLYYQALTSYAAPWNITAASGAWLSMSGSSDISSYVNRVRQKGSDNGISDLRTESYAGDGVRKEFKMLYAAYSNVAVTVNGAAKTIGIRGVSSGKDFYWSQGSDLITQDDSGTVLTSSDTLAVTYRGQVSMLVQLDDEAGIAAHGLYEGLYEDTSALYLNLTVQAAETHLRQNPFDKTDLTYTTDTPGLRAGMVQGISGVRGIDDQFFLTSVRADDLAAADGSLRYTVGCVNGERAEDWADWLRKVAGQADYSLRTNEIVSKCVKIAATCELSSSVSYITKPAGKWDDGTSKWDGGVAWW